MNHIERVDTDIRLEKDERNRAWYTATEAIERISQWYIDPSGSGTIQDLKDDQGNKKAKKKERKGGAMETALRAFIDRKGSIIR